jgi:hypothetical protein
MPLQDTSVIKGQVLLYAPNDEYTSTLSEELRRKTVQSKVLSYHITTAQHPIATISFAQQVT